MFHPLSTLFHRPTVGWQEVDIKYFIEKYFREKMQTDALYCEKVHNGVAVVRVATPAVRQEATLLEFELARDLKQQTQYWLRQLIVYVS